MSTLNLANGWWLRSNELPPEFELRKGKDLIFEYEEKVIKRRCGLELILKDYYILHQNNSQTILSLTYESKDPKGTVNYNIAFEKTPNLSKNILNQYSEVYGSKIFLAGTKLLEQGAVIKEPLIPYVFKDINGILPAVGLRSYGAIIYSNSNNTDISQIDNFRPGDILAINKAKFQGHNKLHQKVIYEVGNGGYPFSAIITEFDHSKKKFRVIEVDEHSGKLKHSSYKPSDMKSGKIKVFRPVGRDYVGW